MRNLWDRWWPHRDEMQRMILPAKVWRLSGTRPLNHPQRRLAALSILVRDWPAFRHASGKRTVLAANDFFRGLDHPFWKFHYTLTAAASPKAMALIGESRVAEILAFRGGKRVGFGSKEYVGSTRWIRLNQPGYFLYSEPDATHRDESGQPAPPGLGLAASDVEELSSLVSTKTPVTITE